MILDLKICPDFRDSLSKYPDDQLDAMQMPVEIPWEPAQVPKMLAHPDVKFIIFVKDVRTMAAAAERLSRALKFDITTLETGKLALRGKGDKKWGDFIKGLGPVAARGLVLRLVTRAVERGNRADSFVEIADHVLFDGLRPVDVDIIARVQELRRKK
jgi:hypothetical protein